MDFPSHVNLPEDARKELVALLNSQLANAIDLYLQLKHAHWNAKGEHFLSRHELFDKLADRVRGQYDVLAERVAQLGGYAEGTARMVAKNSGLLEYEREVVDGNEQVALLADRYAAYAAGLRDAIACSEESEDAATADVFTELLREAEMDLWFLEAHLVEPRRGAYERRPPQPHA